MKTLLCGAAALGLLAFTPAKAEVWNLDNPMGALGPSHIYSDGAAGDPTITATAVGPGNPSLFGENALPEDVGVGLTNSVAGDNEITPGSWVSFDITNLVGRTASADVSFAASSTDGGDIWHIYGSTTPGVLGTSILAGTGDAIVGLVGVIGTWSFLNVTADAGPTGNGTVLANEIDARVVPVATPEPSSLSLLAMAAAGFGLFFFGIRCEHRRAA